MQNFGSVDDLADFFGSTAAKHPGGPTAAETGDPGDIGDIFSAPAQPQPRQEQQQQQQVFYLLPSNTSC